MPALFVQENQIVAGFVPVDMQTAANTADVVSLKGWGHVAVVLYKAIGTAGDDPILTILQGTDVAFGTNKALNFTEVYVKQGTQTSIGTFTKITQAAANTYTEATSAEVQAIWVVEFDAEDLDVDGGYDCIRASVADVGGNAQLGCLLYILSQPRAAGAVGASAIVD